MARFFTVVLLVLCACPHTVAPPPAEPPPPVVHVPEGCLANLSGHWVHSDSSYQYDAFDDGGTLSLFGWHRFTPDAGPHYRQFAKPHWRDAGAEQPDAGPAVTDAGFPQSPTSVVTLLRTPAGFAGEAVAQVAHPVGRTCEARWKTEVLSCLDGGLTLRSEAEVALGDVCQPPVNPQPTHFLEHRLVRAP